MALSDADLARIGFKSIGKSVSIHESVLFFNAANIVIGNNVRIDCFSILSAGDAGIRIGSHIHIGAGCYIFGSGGEVVLEDFSGLSPRASLFTASDDFTCGYLRGPGIPMRFRQVKTGGIVLRVNAGVASGSIVLPGVTVGTNACVGALTVVTKNVPDHALVAGNPAREIKCRDEKLYQQLIMEFRESLPPE
jgi:acetyltransferase-like isoleucine patch superfamily enzyme